MSAPLRASADDLALVAKVLRALTNAVESEVRIDSYGSLHLTLPSGDDLPVRYDTEREEYVIDGRVGD